MRNSPKKFSRNCQNLEAVQTKAILDILPDVFEWPTMSRGQRRRARFAAIIASAMKYLALPLTES
jgi:hypothetical protein